MKRSNRGAARISLVWVIAAGVVALAALAFGFISQSDLSKERERAQAAAQAKVDADDRFEQANELKRNISEMLGWYDRDSADPQSDVETAQRALEDLKSTFTDLGATEPDFELALPKIIAAYNQRGREIAERDTRIQTLQNDVTAANDAVSRIQSDKDQVIADLRQQLADEQANAAQRQTELEDRLTTAQDQLSERDSELRTVRSESVDKEREWDNEKKILQGQNANLLETTKFARDPFHQYPDGKVIEVSRRLPIGWIDLGTNNRLTRGVRFRVESATATGTSQLKAWAEVTRVEANRAEVVFTGLVDAYDPVVRGDVIINPLFDPVGGRNAALVGRFSGEFNKTDLEALLGRMSIHVQPEVDHTTHFLIVGSLLYTDPETSEPLEEPLSPTELPMYRNAEALGVQIIPLQDIREFFRIEPTEASSGR